MSQIASEHLFTFSADLGRKEVESTLHLYNESMYTLLLGVYFCAIHG